MLLAKVLRLVLDVCVETSLLVSWEVKILDKIYLRMVELVKDVNAMGRIVDYLNLLKVDIIRRLESFEQWKGPTLERDRTARARCGNPD